MKRLVASAALAALAGCYPVDYQAGPFKADDGQKLGDSWGEQRCVDGETATRVFEAGLVELEKIFPDAITLRLLKGVATCLTAEPVPCEFSNFVSYYPGHEPPSGSFQRVAGCAGMGSIWFVQVSRNWPPVCRVEWQGEPNCVASPDDPRRVSYSSNNYWTETAAHELLNLYALRVLQTNKESDVAWLHTTEKGGIWDQVSLAMFFATGG